MRSSLTILTLALTLLFALQQRAQAQHGWDPAYYGHPAARAVAPQTYYGVPASAGWMPASPTTYSTFVGDAGNGDATKGKGDAKGGGGKCGACQRDRLINRTFASLEYMQWWNHGRNLPALVTTSPVGTPQVQAGVLGFPTTDVLFGDGAIGDNLQPACRLTVGTFLDDCRDVAVGARIFGVEGHESGYFATSTGDPILGIPFYNDDPLVSAEDAVLVAFPGFTTGQVNVDTNSEIFGTEFFLRYLMDKGCNYRLDVFTGYHFTRINDDLTVAADIVNGPTTFNILDEFHASNEFHGGSLGLAGEWDLCRWTLSALGKVSYGNMHQRVAIAGQTTATGGGVVTTPGGIFAQPTNINTHERDVTVVLPEANFKVTQHLNERLSVSVGYTLMYWNRVALAGDHVDHNVNGTQFSGGTRVGPATPAFAWADTDMWVQTIDVGVNWNY